MAISLNGTDQNVSIGDQTPLKITGDLTISMWLNPTDFTARRNPYAKAYGGEGTITQETSGQFNYYYGTNGGNAHPYQGIGSSSAISLNEWSHVVLVRDLTNMQVRWYINGFETKNSAASYATATAGTLPVTIGSGYVSNYSGEMDDLRVYNRALPANEVATMFAMNGADGIVRNLQARWLFNENAPGQVATTVNDIGINSLHGTPGGSPVYSESRLTYRRLV